MLFVKHHQGGGRESKEMPTRFTLSKEFGVKIRPTNSNAAFATRTRYGYMFSPTRN